MQSLYLLLGKILVITLLLQFVTSLFIVVDNFISYIVKYLYKAIQKEVNRL